MHIALTDTTSLNRPGLQFLCDSVTVGEKAMLFMGVDPHSISARFTFTEGAAQSQAFVEQAKRLLAESAEASILYSSDWKAVIS